MTRVRGAGLLLAALCFVGVAWAEEGAPLTGTLQAINDHGAIRIGYRESAPPFSFLNAGHQPVGFSIDICHGIASDVALALHRELLEPGAPAWETGLRIQYVPVAPDARLPMVVSGQIDLECGSTTATNERAKTVAFSPTFFLAGTKLMVPVGSAIASLRTAAGHSVVVGAGTTNAEVVRRLAAPISPAIKIVTAPDLEAAFQMLADGRADAFASDDILLSGLIATHPGGARFRVVGDYLSYEPYAIVLRRDDPAFLALVRDSFGRMAQEGALSTLYKKWLTERLPNGENLNLPISPYLAEMYRVLGEP